jgi:hypothetical protein
MAAFLCPLPRWSPLANAAQRSVPLVLTPTLPPPAPCAFPCALVLHPDRALSPRHVLLNTLQEAQQVGAAGGNRVCCGRLGRQLHPWVISCPANIMWQCWGP